MARNLNSPYARFAKNVIEDGEWYIVAASGGVEYSDLGGIFPPDSEEGLPRVYASPSAVFSQSGAIVAGRGDTIFIDPSYTTALTAAELLSAETNGVTIRYRGPLVGNTSQHITNRATAALPASTQSALFTVTGRVKVISIIGETTTAIQAQTCNTKLVSNPTVGNDVDLCATADITGDTVGSQYSITGTFANALVETPSGAFVYQASPTVVTAGTIDLSTDATNTGSIKWLCIWEPIDPGARVIAA